MLALIAFCILFLLCASSASGAAKLFMIVTSPGELFGSWQKVLNRIEPNRGDRHYFFREFWYKRLGGCIVCTRQFIAEISFIVFATLYNIYGTFSTEFIDNGILRWVLNIALFIGYCGITLQIGQWLEYEKREADAAKDQEKIIETIYKQKPSN